MIVFETKMKDVSGSALERFARQAQKLAGVQGEVAVLITDSPRIQELNRRFRRKDKPTDVLSFSREHGGDIAICAPIALANARDYGLTAAQELKLLVLHGMLHLAGYDHETDSGQMAKKEALLRTQLKLPSSLIQRTLSGEKRVGDRRSTRANRARRSRP